ncbi:lipoprotein-releasing ABC transporter permease subunit [Pelagibius marinus]|uniref:lipoprotein-releasing ABC transporter permease subunit n=1 Tax=Pelagibius marinus TaxID=2762760 RepID=UPI00187281A3|nr:lipoprotein-releasing ABC transporter permease subunit [Pelagibius marinus]
MIFNAFERLVASRYLRARREEGFVSVIAVFSFLGIMLGVAVLIIVMAVMNGFRQELLSRILGVNGHLTVFSSGPAIQDFDDVAKRLMGVDGVVSVTPQVQGQVMVTVQGSATGALVRGMRPQDVAARPILADNIVAGSMDDYGKDDGILIGQRLAQTLGVWVGDKITLVSPSGNTTVIGTVPRLKSYRIAALFDVGMYEYDNGFIYMPLEAAQLFYRLPKAVNAIEVFVDDPDHTRATLNAMQASLGADYRTVDWQRSNAAFFGAIQTERNVMFLILSLIIVVAAFNVLSGQTMLVKDKGRDIAILRTMGATRGMVMRIFFLSGASIGVVGTAFGFVLGFLFADNIQTIREFLQNLTGIGLFPAEIYFLSRLPAVVDVGEVVLIVGLALALSFLAPLYPAWRAARLDPVEALRYE